MKKSMKCKKLVAIAMTAAMFLSAGMSVFAGKSTVKKRGDSVSVRTNHSYSDDDDWEDDVPRDVTKGKRKREDLDYRRMETLEFEDDEYSYYVEATPKRGGR